MHDKSPFFQIIIIAAVHRSSVFFWGLLNYLYHCVAVVFEVATGNNNVCANLVPRQGEGVAIVKGFEHLTLM
jgi:hypothetical protein